MRFCRVCAVQLVIPNGVVTSGIVPPYSGPVPDPPVPMKVLTQSTGEVSAACVAVQIEAMPRHSSDLNLIWFSPRQWGVIGNYYPLRVPCTRPCSVHQLGGALVQLEIP